MAVDVPAVHAHAPRATALRSLVAAIPAPVALTAIVAVSFAVRLLASIGHVVEVYFPDEYIYSSLGRSIAESGKPLVRGGPAHFPALLEPLLAAPLWLFHDPVLAFRLVQAENALAMSLAAVPAYLLARRIGLGYGTGLACAALAVACPDLMYTSFVVAEPIAYPLALAAVYAGVCALERPSPRGQLAFLALAGLATFARVQYVFLPVAFLAASVAVERGRVRAAFRSVRFSLVLLALPLLAVAALGPSRVLGYYSAITNHHVGLGMLRWIANDALLLTYAAGWILVPGAIAGIALALWRPASRAEAAFGGIVTACAAALFVEAALYASNGSARFQERYLFLLIPLAAPSFGLFVRRAGAGRLVVPAIAFGLLVLSSRVPLSGYTAANAKQDSPFLFAAFQLEHHLGNGTGSLAIALLAAVLSVAAGAVALSSRRRTLGGAALGVALVLAIAVSVGATAFDHVTNTVARETSFAGGPLRWVDEAHVGPTDLVLTEGTPPERPLEQLSWNTSLRRMVRLDWAQPVDVFATPHMHVAADGRLFVDGKPETRALLVSSFATQAELAGVDRVRQGVTFALYRPGTPRLSVLAIGLYHDGWLANSGAITVWPRATGRTHGTLRVPLSLPPGPGAMSIRLYGKGFSRRVTVKPGSRVTVAAPVPGPDPWVLHYRSVQPGRLSDGRAISMMAARPTFR